MTHQQPRRSAQSFSANRWINGTRQPSDELLEKLAEWMVKDGYLKSRQKSRLLKELLRLKYMEHLSPFVRKLARDFHQSLIISPLLRVAKPAPAYQAKRRS